MTALGVVLASILAFLYVRTQGTDDSSYFETVASLRQLKQLDARWELDVLKSRMGIDTSYDSLVDPLANLNELRSKLKDVVTSRPHRAAAELAQRDAELQQALVDKTRLVEHFKSHNSVLRNSLAFLPTAADDVQQAINQSGGGDAKTLRQVSAAVNQILLDTMVYSQVTSSDKGAEVEAELARLSELSNLATPVADSLKVFTPHVWTVLREQPLVNGLLNNIAEAPVAMHIDDLDILLSKEQQDAELQAQRYRWYLLIFAAALVALLLYAAVSLVRSHAVIQRFNKELQGANATLEQRVEERTRELHAAQSELVSTARQAGMAEIATNVLHNVGNVLNSVNVSADVVRGKVRDSKSQGLGKAVQLIRDHAADLGDFLTRDEKGKLLPGYLVKLAGALEAEQREILEEMGHLTKSVDHIKEIVATQQSYAGASSVVESVLVHDLVEDALRMNSGSLTRHHVGVVNEVGNLPRMQLDKHRVLLILINLISNAKNAMNGVNDRPHQIKLQAEVAWPDRLSIRVTDNGCGIAPEHLTRVFAHGFTTRKDGHGFGLHSSAIAAKEMGGTLIAHSDGPGAGATFTLDLPLAQLAQAA
jgi:signal transduction histidine kinase